MQDFIFYLKEGWEHILSWSALDHLLFILALAAIYVINDWRKVLILVTAFTIGHSLTLALSVYNIIKVKESLVEFLIPCTIMITAIFNLLQKNYEQKKVQLNYFFALFFGLIHGLVYANTIRFMLAKDQSMGWSLFSFNVGLEFAQILIVILILFCSYLFVNKIGVKRKWWVFALSISSFCIALKMALERLP
jgi:hypothetical protein